MIITGQDGIRRLVDLQNELLDRDATAEDRAEVEICKAIALCGIEQHLANISSFLSKRGGGAW